MLRICAVASEVAPFAKTGGLADVAAALTKYLHAQGHDVRLFMPLYSAIDRERFTLTPAPRLAGLGISIGAHHYPYSVFTALLPGSDVQVYLIDCPPLYSARSSSGPNPACQSWQCRICGLKARCWQHSMAMRVRARNRRCSSGAAE